MATVTETEWAALVEHSALDTLGNELCQLESGAISTAVEAAKLHAHKTFLWSISHRRQAAAPATEHCRSIIDNVCVKHPTRAQMIKAASTSVARPVVAKHGASIDGIFYRTTKVDWLTAVWELNNPAGGMLADIRAARLERSDATGVYEFLLALLSPAAIKKRAQQLATASAFVQNKT
jgi:hypothetical protein